MNKEKGMLGMRLIVVFLVLIMTVAVLTAVLYGRLPFLKSIGNESEDNINRTGDLGCSLNHFIDAEHGKSLYPIDKPWIVYSKDDATPNSSTITTYNLNPTIYSFISHTEIALNVSYDEPVKAELVGPSQPEPLSVEDQLRDWDNGYLRSRATCHKDDMYYWIHYNATILDGTSFSP